jgi:outer membrane protein insertion porin family
MSYIPFKAGENISDDALETALQALFATELFADIKAQFRGETLELKVVENQTINQIAFEGNKKIDDDIFKAEIGVHPRQVYTAERIQNAINKIRWLYRIKGYYGASIIPKIIRLPQGRVNVIFEIKEGKSFAVNSITFVGNRAFSDATLRDRISTQESRWYRFFSSDDIFDRDRLSYDRELLQRYYGDFGYLDFQILSTTAELSHEDQGFYITFNIFEGKPYTIKDIKIKTTIPRLKKMNLREHIEIEPGDVAARNRIRQSITKLEQWLDDQGVFANIEATPQKNEKTHEVSLTFDITKRIPINVRRILITGNQATDDRVIRREMELAEGDILSEHKLETSKWRLHNLDYFSTVNVDTSKNPDGTHDVDVTVQDKSTGELMFSGGYSSFEGFFIEAKAAERNLLGRGQELELRTKLAKRSKGVYVSFLEPYFLDRRMQGGVDIFYETLRQGTKGDLKGGYTSKDFGLTLKLGYTLVPRLFQNWRYSIARQDFNNRSDSVFFKNVSKDTLSSVGHSLVYDKRNSMIAPTSGYYISLATDFAGVGGSVRFLKNKISAGTYFSFDDDHDYVLRLKGHYGILTRVGRPIRVVDHFYMGGVDLRGFSEAGIGPRDKKTNDAIGGKQSLLFNAELSTPLFNKDFGLKGILLTDWGCVWKSGKKNGPYGDQIISNGFRIRGAVGIGIRWQSPFGMIGCSWSRAVKYVKGVDNRQVFRLDIGTDF